jgi:hypothetical protein
MLQYPHAATITKSNSRPVTIYELLLFCLPLYLYLLFLFHCVVFFYLVIFLACSCLLGLISSLLQFLTYSNLLRTKRLCCWLEIFVHCLAGMELEREEDCSEWIGIRHGTDQRLVAVFTASVVVDKTEEILRRKA